MTPMEAEFILSGGPTDNRKLCEIFAKRRVTSIGLVTLFSSDAAYRGYLSNLRDPGPMEEEEAKTYGINCKERIASRFRIEQTRNVDQNQFFSSQIQDAHLQRHIDKFFGPYGGPPKDLEIMDCWYDTFGPLGFLGPNFLRNFPSFPTDLIYVTNRVCRLHMWFFDGINHPFKTSCLYRIDDIRKKYGGRS